MIILGIETSCDETSVAVVDDQRRILAHDVLSQLDIHQEFGGVVPEIAARAHLTHLPRLIQHTMQTANIKMADLSAVAATGGPGLIGGVLVGVMAGKAMALAQNIPFIGVNHLEGHALTVRLSHGVDFPYLLLLVSGGHCAILSVRDVGDYALIGQTIDDAAGEAFDKVAKMLGLPYPGGPQVERLARDGNEKRFDLPRPLKGRPGCDFSFSGLKTAVRQVLKDLGGGITPQDKKDVCASFQAAVRDVLVDKMARAIQQAPADRLVVAGGVAANQYLRAGLQTLAQENKMEFIAPPIELCTDNAAMIAWAGMERLQKGWVSDLDFKPRPRWPLNKVTGEAV